MTCIVCGNKDTKKIYDILLQCNICNYIWADVEVSAESLRKVYDKGYFFGDEYSDYLKEEKALRKSFERNLKLISKYRSSGRMLEIGCAYGFFLDTARNNYDVEGIDISDDACKYAREQLELNVRCEDFIEKKFKENHYDVIVMWATLEHLKDPSLYVEKISSILKPGGIFVCTTPDIGSPLARIQKSKWRQIHPPTHLSYFSKNTIEKLFSKYNLKLVETTWLGEYRTIDQALYIILVLQNKMEKLYSFIKNLKLNKGIFYLNTYDQMCTVAVK